MNISERCQKVWQCLCGQAKKSIRDIADSTGIPKSSVHRHKKAIEARQKHKESYLWATEEGGEWLRLLVFGVIYCFGIKKGLGADTAIPNSECSQRYKRLDVFTGKGFAMKIAN